MPFSIRLTESAAAWSKEETEEEMTAQRMVRANRKTAEERAREGALRQKLQKERPSLEDLVRTGACDPDTVMTMGMYFDVQKALQALKQDRQRRGLSIQRWAAGIENAKGSGPTTSA
jgi:hypothetical protein